MKVFISVDMEGISGLVRWADVASRGIDYPRNRRLMTQDTNAAIAGAFAGGASEVVVEENHGVEDLCNLLMDEIDPRVRVVRGAGRLAGAPIGMVSGDQVVAEQVTAICPWVETVIVKEALANQSGNCLAPTRAREIIEAGARRAVERAREGRLGVYRGVAAPYDFEVVLREPMSETMRDNLAGQVGFEVLDEVTVAITAPDAELGFRRVAYLGYANRPGATRY
jgi:D-aminopeptidase